MMEQTEAPLGLLAPDLSDDVSIIRQRALDNTMVFMKAYRKGAQMYPHQLPWGKRVDDLSKKMRLQISLEPRGHGKSEVYTISYVLRQICRNPKIRILVVSATSGQAEFFLGSVKRELESNEKILEHFGDMTSRKKTEGLSTWAKTAIHCQVPTWREDEIAELHRHDEAKYSSEYNGVWRNQSFLHKDPTVLSVGVTTAITGGRYDVIIFDDIQDVQNVKNAIRVDDMIEWFDRTVWGMREVWTKFIIVGTRKGQADFYSRMMKRGGWQHSVGKAIQWPKPEQVRYDEVLDEDNVLTGLKNIRPSDDAAKSVGWEPKTPKPPLKLMFPEKWSEEELMMEFITTPGPFLSERQNSLKGFGVNVFDSSHMKWYKPEKIGNKMGLVLYISIDPSTDNKSKENDYCAISSGFYHPQKGIMYMYKLFYQRVEAADIVKVTNDFIDEHKEEGFKPAMVTIESVASQVVHYQHLARQGDFEVQKTDSKVNKDTRLKGMAPKIKYGRIQFPLEFKEMWTPFVVEYDSYPNGNDDAMDTTDFTAAAAESEGIGGHVVDSQASEQSEFFRGSDVEGDDEGDRWEESTFSDPFGPGSFEDWAGDQWTEDDFGESVYG